MPHNVLIMGPPGSGKGTQAARIAARQGLAHISTGDMLRAAIEAGTDLGEKVAAILKRGDLVPDDLMLELVKHRLEQSDTVNGFLLDGFPRTVTQAEALLVSLEGDRALEGVIHMVVPEDELVRRALSRGRNDDTEETIRHRLRVYHDKTKPVLELLDGKVTVHVIDGVGDMDEITVRIVRALES